MQLGFVLSLVFAIIIAVFALNNGDKVTIDFLFTTQEVSQALVILVSTAFGAIIVAVFGLVRQIKLSLKVKDQGKKIKALQDEKEELLMKLEGKSGDKPEDAKKPTDSKENKQQKSDKLETTNDQPRKNELGDKQAVENEEKTDKDLERKLEKELQKED